MNRLFWMAVVAILVCVLGGSVTAAAGTPTVLVFGLGERCNYCVELKKDIGRVKEKVGGAVRFQDVRVDQEFEMVKKHKVLLSPTLIFFDPTGAEVLRHQGILDDEQILEKLATHKLWNGAT